MLKSSLRSLACLNQNKRHLDRLDILGMNLIKEKNMAFTTNQSAVAELYIAALGRSPEMAGLNYWVGRLESTGSDALTLTQIQAAFFDNNIAEVAARFPAGTTAAQYVEAIYVNVFGRASDAGGLEYWSAKIATDGADSVMAQMLTIAKDPVNSVDKAYLESKIATATAAYDAEVAEANQVVGQTFTLTTSADVSGVMLGSDGTTSTDGNNTFTATTATLTADDVLIGGTGIDTLNVTATASSTAPSTIVGVENINFNVASFDSAIAMDANNIIGVGTTITVNNTQAGGTTAATVNNVESGATVVAGSGVTGTFTVDADGYATINGGSATTVTVDLNGVATASTITANSATTINVNNAVAATVSSTSATTINLEGTAGTTDTVTLSAKNATSTSVVALETLVAGQQVEKLILSGNGGAVTYDLDATGDDTTTLTFTGNQNVTFVATAAQLSGDTATDTMTAGTSTIKIDTTSAATHDLDALAVDMIDLAATTAAAATYNVLNSQAVKLSATAGGHVTIDSVVATNTDTAETLNLTVAATQTSNVVVTDFETVNLTVDDGAATTGTITLADLQGTAATAGVINVFGADNLTLTGANATFLNATNMTGVLTATLASDLLKVTGGSGNDTINASALVFTVDGGAGIDTLQFEVSADLAAIAESISNVEVLKLDGTVNSNNTLDVSTDDISGKTYVVTGSVNGGTKDILNVKTATTGTLDLSGLTVNDTDVKVTIDLTATAGVANTITGSNASDTTSNAGAGAITINSGAGADVIVTGTAADTITLGEGADSVDAGAGADTIILTETTAAVDTVIIAAGDSTEAAMDKISGFTTHASTGDILQIANAAINSATVAIADATSFTTETDSGTITAAVSATGILTLGGTATANVNTLAEWIDIAEAAIASNLLVQDTQNTRATIAFEFSGNTYVVQGVDSSVIGGGAITYATEAVVELTGVTGITGLSATAAANVIDIA